MNDIEFIIGQGIVINKSDVVIIEDEAELIQEIKIESITAEGDLWHDQTYGWSLQDFLHREIDEMLELEIIQRVKEKLSKRNEIDQESITVLLIKDKEDVIRIKIRFSIGETDVDFEVLLDRSEVKIDG